MGKELPIGMELHKGVYARQETSVVLDQVIDAPRRDIEVYSANGRRCPALPLRLACHQNLHKRFRNRLHITPWQLVPCFNPMRAAGVGRASRNQQSRFHYPDSDQVCFAPYSAQKAIASALVDAESLPVGDWKAMALTPGVKVSPEHVYR